MGKGSNQRGSAITTVLMLTALMLVVTVAFLKRSTIFSVISGIANDRLSSELQLSSAYESGMSKMRRALDSIVLIGKLQYVGGPSAETFTNISNQYAANQVSFLQHLVTSQAYSGAGALDSSSEFASFSTAFPTSFTDPNSNDGQYYELQYTFTPITMITELSPQKLTFEYEYRLQVRAYGQTRFQTQGSDDSGVIQIVVDGAPFSQYAQFMNSMLNQYGNLTVFAGGDTSSQVKEIFRGPVHVNSTPYFYGSPVFTDSFTSTAAEASWVQLTGTNYSGSASFQGTHSGGAATINYPSAIFNTVRLASGDTSSNAATNNNTVSNSDLRTFMAAHANGTLTSGTTAVPSGIYVPVNSAASLVPTGGVYVQGDANIVLDVVQGSSDFNTTQWNQMSSSHRSCKFQKISITPSTSGVTARDIYVGDDPCEVTYIYDATNTANTPVVLNGRINGNIHVDGAINQLGGASRTRPAIAQDFAYTISATKDVKIYNDIQYEDATYVSVDSSGNLGTTTVATPTGQYNGSGITPTSADIAATIDSESHTALGIISTQRNVLIHSSAPANLNVHAAIYAGNSAAYDSATGYGCGSSGSTTQGCGFGYESWTTATGKGQFKAFGSITQYKGQSLGVVSSTPTGYVSRIFYDSRLRQSIQPPGFPVSDAPRVTATLKPYRTWRVSQLSP